MHTALPDIYLYQASAFSALRCSHRQSNSMACDIRYDHGHHARRGPHEGAAAAAHHDETHQIGHHHVDDPCDAEVAYMLYDLVSLEAEYVAFHSVSSSVRPPSPEVTPEAEMRMEALWSTLERCDIQPSSPPVVQPYSPPGLLAVAGSTTRERSAAPAGDGVARLRRRERDPEARGRWLDARGA